MPSIISIIKAKRATDDDDFRCYSMYVWNTIYLVAVFTSAFVTKKAGWHSNENIFGTRWTKHDQTKLVPCIYAHHISKLTQALSDSQCNETEMNCTWLVWFEFRQSNTVCWYDMFMPRSNAKSASQLSTLDISLSSFISFYQTQKKCKMKMTQYFQVNHITIRKNCFWVTCHK